MAEGNEGPFLAFLILVLVVGAGSFLFGDFNNRFTKVFRQATIWVMIFLGTVLLFSFRHDIEAALLSNSTMQVEGDVIVLTRASDGHFYATLDVNAAPIEFVVDTGATSIVLSKSDATRAGLDPDNLVFSGRANTANGVVETAPARVAVMQLGDRIDRNLRVSVNGGELDTSLLGMAYLNRFGRLEIERNKMRLYP